MGRRLFWLLLLLAALAVSPTPGSDRPPVVSLVPPARLVELPGSSQAVLVSREDGEFDARNVPFSLNAIDEAQLDHLWAWSSTCAATRVSRLEIAGFRCASSASVLEAHVSWPGSRTRPPQPAPPGRILAASREMWGDIPEPLLPVFALNSDGVVKIPRAAGKSMQLRFSGPGLASDWTFVSPTAKRVDLVLSPSAAPKMQILGPDGKPVSRAQIMLSMAAPRGDDFRALYATAAKSRGLVELAPLPASQSIVLVAAAQGALPRRVSTTVEHLPAVLRLDGGCVLVGQVVDIDGRPIPEARLHGEGFGGGGSDLLLTSEASSDAKGAFRLGPLPVGSIVVSVEAKGLGRESLKQSASSCVGEWPMGKLTLGPAVQLAVRVVDRSGAPVPGARVQPERGEAIESDQQGRAELKNLPAGAALSLAVSAAGFRAWEKSIPPPLPKLVSARLERSARVRGRLVDKNGTPIPDGSVRVISAAGFHDQPLQGDGSFEIDLEPGRESELRFRAPSTLEAIRKVPALDPGRMLDLGDVVPPDGWSVKGCLVRTDTGEPIVGGHASMPRPSSKGGPMVAWAFGDVSSATSGLDGCFVLSGLIAGPTSIRFEAIGLAPADLAVAPQDGNAPLDLGEVQLGPGATIHVIGNAEQRGLARADWKGRWREADMITASFTDGEAWIEHVPEGTSRVSVLDGQKILCEESVQVPALGTVDVDCEAKRLRVHGTVTVGRQPSSAGLLTWHTQAQNDTLVFNTRSPGGASKTQIFGAGRPQVDVPVDATGAFISEDLAPGSWQVLWTPEGGGSSASRAVTLPEEGDVTVTLAFSANALAGTVVDKQGSPVADARVEDLDSHANARSGADGSFTLLDLAPGRRRVRASKESERSAIAAVDVHPDEPPAPIVLVIDRSGQDRVHISVTSDGQAAAGALVFVEIPGQGLRIVTADASGTADLDLTPPRPPNLRAAAVVAGRWVLGSWVATDAALESGLSLPAIPGGGLEVKLESGLQRLEIVSEAGWNLSALLDRLGVPPEASPGYPLRLDGLPAGAYTIQAGESTRSTAVSAGEIARLVLP
ncbi:MAG: carboxypeptidase-like regulatory domain-containing protein [Acidobacteriota bacterium]